MVPLDVPRLGDRVDDAESRGEAAVKSTTNTTTNIQASFRVTGAVYPADI